MHTEWFLLCFGQVHGRAWCLQCSASFPFCEKQFTGKNPEPQPNPKICIFLALDKSKIKSARKDHIHFSLKQLPMV